MEQLDYNLLLVATTFTKNRARLLEGDIAQRFLRETVALAQEDGTPLEAWASQKSFKPKDGSGSGGSVLKHRGLPEVDWVSPTPA